MIKWAFVKRENWKDKKACEPGNWGKVLWKRKINGIQEEE